MHIKLCCRKTLEAEGQSHNLIETLKLGQLTLEHFRGKHMTTLGGMDWRELEISQKADVVINTRVVNGLRKK